MSEKGISIEANTNATNIVGNTVDFTATGTGDLNFGFNEAYDTNTASTSNIIYSGYNSPAVPEYKGGNQFFNEWSKWRTEFIRELLREEPLGIIDYKQERYYDTKTNTMRVKVTLEYIPEIQKPGVRK